MMRDDGLVLGLGYAAPAPVFFPPVRDFVVANGVACGLLDDAGVICTRGGPMGGYQAMALPPASGITGGGVLCVSTPDAGATCLPSGGFDLTDLEQVIDSNDNLLCGKRFDGGVRCVSNASSSAPFDVNPPPIALWVGATWSSATALYPGGQTVEVGYALTGLRPPPDDAGYVMGGSQVFANCALTTDGRLRCGNSALSASYAPTESTEAFADVHVSLNTICGLTTEGRVRCMGSYRDDVPPRPPARQVSTSHTNSVTLLEDGRLDVRGLLNKRLQPSADDRFVQISRQWSGQSQCALRADGSAICGSINEAGPFLRVGSEFGLLSDGGIHAWGTTAWPAQGPFVNFDDSWQRACAQGTDGGWTCSSPVPFPAGVQLASLSYLCGLTPRGRLVCWGVPIPPSLSQYRFRHISSGGSEFCATTLEGEVFCVFDSQPARLTTVWDDFESFESSTFGCGLRRNRTIACTQFLDWW